MNILLLYKSLGTLIDIIIFLIIFRSVLSFISININSTVLNLIYELTEPVLNPAKRLLSLLRIDTGIIDFSPLVAILIMKIIYQVLGNIII